MTRKRMNSTGSLLYPIALILVVIWAIAYFGYNTGDLIHILIVIAVIAFLFRIIRGNY